MPVETEIKFEVGNEDAMTDRILAAGGRKVSEGLEHNIVFDRDDMAGKGLLLRLRKTGEGKSILTFKRNIGESEFKEAEEIETVVSDFSSAKEILTNLGYEIFWIYEKQKTTFELGGTVVSLDRLPFATFIEIEGSAGSIRNAIARLGLDPKKGRTESYLKLYRQFCEDKGIEMENLVFWRKARPKY